MDAASLSEARHSEFRAGEGPTRPSAVARLRSPHAGAI